MSTNKTTNYKLNLPSDNETADIADINVNMQIIDTQMKEKADAVVKNAADIAAVNVSLSNPNLLHNWELRNPVNQRLLNTYTSGYTIDRWLIIEADTTLKIQNDGILVTPNKKIAQIIDVPTRCLTGKTFTTTILHGDRYKTGTASIPNAVTDWVEMPLLADAECYCALQKTSSDYFRFLMFSKVAKVIGAVKLELGTISTLANDPPQDYGTELTKCQRYYRRIPITAVGDDFAWTDNGGEVGCIYPISNMRLEMPTATIIGSCYAQLRFANGVIVSDAPIMSAYVRQGMVGYSFKKDNNTLPTGAFAYIITSGSADIAVSAEL